MKKKIFPSLQLICSRDRKYQKNKLVIMEKMIIENLHIQTYGLICKSWQKES
jgi:hypothetical protein